MGVEFMVACKTCKITRDLDKFRNAYPINNRAEAMELAGETSKTPFASALLASFMSEHIGHDCVFFSELSECADELDPFENKNGYVEDHNYWEHKYKEELIEPKNRINQP
jgi:hypothetical protein